MVFGVASNDIWFCVCCSDASSDYQFLCYTSTLQRIYCWLEQNKDISCSTKSPGTHHLVSTLQLSVVTTMGSASGVFLSSPRTVNPLFIMIVDSIEIFNPLLITTLNGETHHSSSPWRMRVLYCLESHWSSPWKMNPLALVFFSNLNNETLHSPPP